MNKPVEITKPLTEAEVEAILDAQDENDVDYGYITALIKLPFGQIACASYDNSYDGLNDIVEDLILEHGCMSDITYSAVGVEPDSEGGKILFQVRFAVL